VVLEELGWRAEIITGMFSIGSGERFTKLRCQMIGKPFPAPFVESATERAFRQSGALCQGIHRHRPSSLDLGVLGFPSFGCLAVIRSHAMTES